MILTDRHGRQWTQEQPPKHLHPARVWANGQTRLDRAELERIYGPCEES